MKTKIKHGLLAGAVVLSLAGTTAFAAVDMFLKIDGIRGESTVDRHVGEIEILSYSWEFSPKSGDLVGRTTRVCAHDISFTKLVDKASPLLVSSSLVGTVIPKATLVGGRREGTRRSSS